MVPKLKTIYTDRVDEYKRRIEVCKPCEQYEPVLSKCEECGCFLAFKAMIPSAKCPLGKW